MPTRKPVFVPAAPGLNGPKAAAAGTVYVFEHAPAEEVPPLMAGGPPLQMQLYGPVPPEGLASNVTRSPTSAGSGLTSQTPARPAQVPACEQSPVARLHVSVVQALPSLQPLGGTPALPMQPPQD